MGDVKTAIGRRLLIGVVLVFLVAPNQAKAQEVRMADLRLDEAELRREAVEHFRREAPMGFRVIPESLHVSEYREQATVHFRVFLDNDSLMYVSVVFEREGTKWRYRRLGTLCCGEH